MLTWVVLFKFRSEVSEAHKQAFVKALKTLRDLPCVLNQRLTVGGPSITGPIEKSKGFHFTLVSYHRDRAALEEYQASAEHHNVTSEYIWPYKEDVTRFDYEVDESEQSFL